MDSGWLILTRRYGADVRDPSDTDLAAAVDELFVENLPGMTEGDYAEHGASLRYGFDDGPMYVIAVGRSGTVVFEEWADQDYEEELVPPRTAQGCSQTDALHRWTLLARGDVDGLRALPWD